MIYARYNLDQDCDEPQLVVMEQIALCEEYAKSKGYKVSGYYFDVVQDSHAEHIKMAKLMGRSTWKYHNTKRFDVVVVHSHDRLGVNGYERAFLKQFFKGNGIDVVSVTPHDYNDKGTTIQFMLEDFAEYHVARLTPILKERFSKKKRADK